MVDLLGLGFMAVLAALRLPLEETEGLPVWFIILMVVILVALPILAVWFGSQQAKKGPEKLEAMAKEASSEPVAAAPAESDDLTRIEGIGPKISSVLQAAGIRTFVQLAGTDVADLQQILDKEPRLRLADPGSWPQQADLAAHGDWEALQTLQDSLKAGRVE